jgi:hypothetical protein
MKTNHSIRSAVAALIHALALRVAPRESREGAQTKAPAAPSTPPDLAQGKLRTVAAHGQRPGVDRASILESLSALASGGSPGGAALAAAVESEGGRLFILRNLVSGYPIGMGCACGRPGCERPIAPMVFTTRAEAEATLLRRDAAEKLGGFGALVELADIFDADPVELLRQYGRAAVFASAEAWPNNGEHIYIFGAGPGGGLQLSDVPPPGLEA